MLLKNIWGISYLMDKYREVTNSDISTNEFDQTNGRQ
jgi:hypothetical protein